MTVLKRSELPAIAGHNTNEPATASNLLARGGQPAQQMIVDALNAAEAGNG